MPLSLPLAAAAFPFSKQAVDPMPSPAAPCGIAKPFHSGRRLRWRPVTLRPQPPDAGREHGTATRTSQLARGQASQVCGRPCRAEDAAQNPEARLPRRCLPTASQPDVARPALSRPSEGCIFVAIHRLCNSTLCAVPASPSSASSPPDAPSLHANVLFCRPCVTSSSPSPPPGASGGGPD
ncbi:hypothetical protein CDD83_9594 [Cordyceps sp. RAO-2017]|nr:hypothetical protein CDD83_9594 [Cordyceps sp. RAO-2017]